MAKESALNNLYDLLTILVSIADVKIIHVLNTLLYLKRNINQIATDIIVLIGFYNDDRMVFFFISLSILILAQCAYAMAFSLKFETEPSWGAFRACCCFMCLLPFGTFVAFCFYLNDRDIGDFQTRMKRINLRTDNNLYGSSAYSKSVLWIRNKLNRHLGFLLEAVIEAFPQSMLQIVAIVYYQEANYISIISILLSMFSVMTKSLILSQGIDKWTFIWTWLCAVTDFFGIFFILTWAFYSNEYIYGNYYGLFNIFGFVWFWKFIISALSIAITGLVLFVVFGYWSMIILFFKEGIMLGLVWVLLGPVLAFLMAFAACLGCEVMCFSFLAFANFKLITSRFPEWKVDTMSSVIGWVLDFISNAEEPKIAIVAAAHALYPYRDSRECYVYNITLGSEQHFKPLESVFNEENNFSISYKQLRTKVIYRVDEDGFFKNLLYKICDKLKDRRDRVKSRSGGPDLGQCFCSTLDFLVYALGVFVFSPLLVIGKTIQILFPFFILGYLVYFDLLIGGKVDTFQLVMLFIYIGLQLIVFVIGIKVFKIHWYLYHVDLIVANNMWKLGKTSLKLQKASAKEWMDKIWHVRCYPRVKEMINSIYGFDIGLIILEYLNAIEISDANKEEISDADPLHERLGVAVMVPQSS